MTAPARRILIAEDEAMISMMVEDFLDQLGYHVAGVCMTGAQCQTLLDSGQEVDAALLDCNLGDGPVWTIARRLQDQGVPFLFASGDGGHGVPPDLKGAPVLGKPYLIDALERSLAGLFEG
ncbi:response regulator [Sphingobium sufflavum]|uniref:response regulator n=1 Tax=Sphingobium sufflavum TaxID=1129547 RepID=UPI001F1C3E48|nr:response regulator [Sphingobium sufflavum]MCE7798349.1 response regulator [Sphingobium sufflavum]